MPTNINTSNRNTWDNDALISVLATEMGMRSPRGLTVDLTYLPANIQGNKLIKSGHLLALLPSGLGRIFPASRVTLASSGTAIKVKDASVFKVGEVVTKVVSTSQGVVSAYGTQVAVGTVNAIDVDTNILTVSAAATVALRDTILGTDANSVSNIVGMVLTAKDLIHNPNDVAAYTSCTVYGKRLPYWDTAIQNAFPEITLFQNNLLFL